MRYNSRIMKTLRRLLLPVLLSAFSFIVMHDYIMTVLDADTQYEIYCASDSAVPDLPSQIHKKIHILLTVQETAAPLPEEAPTNSRLYAVRGLPPSYISPIRTKPPSVPHCFA